MLLSSQLPSVLGASMAFCLSFSMVNPAAAQEGGDAAALDPFAEMASLADEMSAATPEAGGSIRAKRDVDPKVRARKKDKRNVEAKVEQIKRGRFPMVVLKLKVIRSAKEGPGKEFTRNASIVVMPAMATKAGQVDMADDATRINAGAFYFEHGDKVVLRPTKNTKGDLWQVDYIERK